MRRKDSNFDELHVTEKYDSREFRRLLFGGGWIRFPLRLVARLKNRLKLDYGQVILLAFLISHIIKVEEEMEENGQPIPDWIYCKGTEIEKKLGMTLSTQAKFFRKLVTSKLVSTQRFGMPPLRHVQVNWQLVIKMSVEK